ncbi:hypothetical protein G7Y89_g12733 [Cudoniella acicularis]|uniref:Heterokaryon incompatibility domain-containing protein n=1 Tax=Cudoniella acicularis TaxID=354080 RepID=A0A8H4R9I6_9HELO|nr:hypothetical protein G7Y89_g12733 [Cudoniella acicularis]
MDLNDPGQMSSLATTTGLYEPLDQSRLQIRLLQWVSSPGNDNAIAHWRLFPVSLEEQPDYIALSYVWGDASITQNITVNSEEVPVTTNLASALERVRKLVKVPNSSLFFWADALCINQKDTLERNSQVQMMGSIYSKAMMVFSWLGLDEDSLTLYAIILFMIAAKERRSPQPAGAHPMQWMLKYPDLCAVGLHETDWDVNNVFWTAARKFFQNPYWKRVWILQEIVLGREVWLMGKTSSILLDDVLRFADMASIFELSSVSRPEFMPVDIWSVISQKGYFIITPLLLVIQSRRRTLDQNMLLLGTFALLASDPRDKIFGLQALVQDATPPNYTMSVKQVYCEAAIKMVSQGPELLSRMLGLSGLGQDSLDDYQLPSWVPNWDFISKAIRESRFHGVAPSNSETRASTSINNGLSENLHPPTRVFDFVVLRTYGCICGVVVSDRLRHNFHNLFNNCIEYVQQNSGLLYPNGDHPLKALLRVLTMDWKHIGEKERKQNDFDFEALYIGTLYCILLLDRVESNSLPGNSLQEEQSWRDNLDQELRSGLEQCGISTEKHFIAFLKLMVSRTTPDEAWESSEARLARIQGHLGGTRLATEMRGPSCLFQTSEGYLGMAPPKCQAGDLVCVLSDCSIPVLLRKVDSHYIHVGACFVLGLMDGEAVQLVRSGKAKMEEFDIH